jgi:hypothetical protein
MTYDTRTRWEGVLAHHADSCPALTRGVCTCGPLGYRGAVDNPDTGGPVFGPPMRTVEDARAWRAEHEVAMTSWQAAASRGDTLDEVIDDFLDAAASGRALDAHGEPFDPDALGGLRWSLQGHVAGELGAMRIADVNGAQLRRLVTRLDERGLSAARTRSVVSSVRSLLRYAAQRGLVSWSAADTLILGDEDPQRPAPARASHHTDYDQPHDTAYDQQRPPPQARGTQGYDTVGARVTPPGMVPDEVIWMVLKIVAISFALIALVLAAESI